MSVLSVVRANPKEPAWQPYLKPSREWITATTVPERERTMCGEFVCAHEVKFHLRVPRSSDVAIAAACLTDMFQRRVQRTMVRLNFDSSGG